MAGYQILYNKGKTAFAVVFPDGRETDTRTLPEDGVALIPDPENHTAVLVVVDGPGVELLDSPLKADTVYELRTVTTSVEQNVEDLGEPVSEDEDEDDEEGEEEEEEEEEVGDGDESEEDESEDGDDEEETEESEEDETEEGEEVEAEAETEEEKEHAKS